MTVLRCRFELRFVEEALSARRIASAHRIRGIGFDETTKFGNTSLTSHVTIEPTEGAPLEDVIARAAYCPLGGTAAKLVQSIEDKCFARLRDHMRRWKAHFDVMHPAVAWTGPDAARCSLHRLGGGGAIMSDTCNAARCAKRLLGEEIARQVEQELGHATWASMSAMEQEAATRTHAQDCWQHIRNIVLAEMSRAMAAHVKVELQPELDTFSAWERMSTEFSQLLRAAYKVTPAHMHMCSRSHVCSPLPSGVPSWLSVLQGQGPRIRRLAYGHTSNGLRDPPRAGRRWATGSRLRRGHPIVRQPQVRHRMPACNCV